MARTAKPSWCSVLGLRTAAHRKAVPGAFPASHLRIHPLTTTDESVILKGRESEILFRKVVDGWRGEPKKLQPRPNWRS